ncbi:unnamed protein product [marine sediment metagenome]|uniref:Uncharacterized protein n=1 Tax=marine sediment metagenome TaxID=412755 RepID=X0W688_9ZZZZ
MNKVINCCKNDTFGDYVDGEDRETLCLSALMQYFDIQSPKKAPLIIRITLREDNPNNKFISVDKVQEESFNTYVKFPEDTFGEFSTDTFLRVYTFTVLHEELLAFYKEIGQKPFYVELEKV